MAGQQHYRSYCGCRVAAPALEVPPVRRAWLRSLDSTQQARHRDVRRLAIAADACTRTPAMRHPLTHREVDGLGNVEALVEAKVERGGEHEDEGADGLARRAERDAVRAEGGGRDERRLVRVRVRVRVWVRVRVGVKVKVGVGVRIRVGARVREAGAMRVALCRRNCAHWRCSVG